MFKKQKECHGFTLIELLVVISIISILAAVVTTSLNSIRSKGRDAKRLMELRSFQTGLALYYDKYKVYPCGDSNVDNAWAGPIFFAEGTADSASSCSGSGPNDSGFLNGKGTELVSNCTGQYQNIGLFTERILPNICPKDPVNALVDGKKMGYSYLVNKSRTGYLLATYLESNNKLMAEDGGVCSGVYEVNIGLPEGYAVPWSLGLGRPANGCP